MSARAPTRIGEVAVADEPGVVRLPALLKGERVYAPRTAFEALDEACRSEAQGGGLPSSFRCGESWVLREDAPEAERGRRFIVFPRADPGRLLERDTAELAASLYSLRLQDVLDYAAGVRDALLEARQALRDSLELVGASPMLDPQMLGLVFDLLPQVFDPQALGESVDRELSGEGRRGRDFLDGWVELAEPTSRGMTARLADLVIGPSGRPRALVPCVRAVPTRQLHVTAGNSPLLPLLSLLRGLSSKGACVVKSPAEASLALAAVGAAMHAAGPRHPITRHTSLLYWPGGDRDTEDVLFAPGAFDRVVVWGSAETVASVRQRAPGTKMVAHNPRYGVSLVRARADEVDEAAARASVDTLVWEQQACTASLVHYVEGDEARALAYSQALARALGRWDERRRRPLPRALQGRIRLLRRGEWLNGTWFENRFAGELSSAVVHMAGAVDLARHPMSRLAVVRRVDRLEDVAATLTAAVSSVGVFPDASVGALRDGLVAAGVSNVFPLGEGERTYPGMPHDGMRVLAELVCWATSSVDDEKEGAP